MLQVIIFYGSNVYIITRSDGRVINYGQDIKVSWQLHFTDYCYN